MRDDQDILLIGVDGGGSGCRIALGTLGKGILATVSGGRANATTDLPLTISNITQAAAQAAVEVGLDPAILPGATAHLGLAGIVTRADAKRLADALPYAHAHVTDDRDTALAGALGEGDGFLVAIGTGSTLAARRNGALGHIGGWGLKTGDQASGAWLGRAALTQTLLAYDGVQPHSPLTQKLLKQFHDDPSQIVTFAASAVPGDYAGFAPAVIDAARNTDATGLALVRESVTYIADGLTALGFSAGDALCLTGGLGPHYAAFLPAKFTGQIVAAKATSVEGAFHLARQAALDRQKAMA